MKQLLSEIRQCQICMAHLPHGIRPILNASNTAQIALIGQAPGKKVHESGIPWKDPSGVRLRSWLDVTEESFYDPTCFAIIPMGFCYPGKGNSGDLPPRPECAPTWHEPLFRSMPSIKLTILIGQYAQKFYLGDRMNKNLTETVRSFRDYAPSHIVLPHPSPRNRFWLSQNKWFEQELVPFLQSKVQEILDPTGG